MVHNPKFNPNALSSRRGGWNCRCGPIGARAFQPQFRELKIENMYLGVERSPSSRCAEDVVAPEQPSGIGSKKRKAVDTFWKDSEFSRTEVEAAIHIAIEEIKASESGQFRIAEDAKRCLAVALDVFLRTHFHIVSLLAQHRGSQTPKRDDFLLAELLSDEAAVQNSVEKADLESGTVRKRSRGPQTERVDWSFKSKGFEILRVEPVGDLYTGSKARPPGAKNSAGSFRTQWPIQFLCGSISKRFLSGSVPHGSRIPVRIDS